MSIRVFTSSNVLLTGSTEPHPATIEVDTTTGKITAIHNKRSVSTTDYPDLTENDFHDAGDAWILPGLVE